MSFGRLGALGRGFGRLGSAGRGSGVTLPTAPVLAMDALWTSADNTPDFTADFDATVGAGDTFRLQIQVAGGDWSSPVSDTNHVITAPEDAADEASLSNGILSNGNYEARCNVTHGVLTSNWSNTVSFTVAATATAGTKVYPYLLV